MQDAQTSQVDGYGGMKVNFFSHIFAIFLYFFLAFVMFFSISFDLFTDKSDGEGKCLTSNPTEA